MATCWIIPLCLALLYTVSQADVTCLTGQHVTFTRTTAKRLVDQTSQVTTYPNIAGAMQCFSRCKELTECKAFNYNAGSTQCEVLKTDAASKLEADSHWNFYDVKCGTAEPTSEPTSEPEAAPEGEPEITADDVYKWVKENPEYIAMIGMGLVIIFLFITVIVILCCYSGGASKSDKYREKA